MLISLVIVINAIRVATSKCKQTWLILVQMIHSVFTPLTVPWFLLHFYNLKRIA